MEEEAREHMYTRRDCNFAYREEKRAQMTTQAGAAVLLEALVETWTFRGGEQFRFKPRDVNDLPVGQRVSPVRIGSS